MLSEKGCRHFDRFLDEEELWPADAGIPGRGRTPDWPKSAGRPGCGQPMSCTGCESCMILDTMRVLMLFKVVLTYDVCVIGVPCVVPYY